MAAEISENPLDVRGHCEAVLIAGPTASGKSALALDLARRLGGAIVNADSMQVYDALRILTARPSPADEAEAPHFLYGHVAAGQAYSVGAWYSDAERVVATIKAEGLVPIIVGGTGLYFRALLGGLSQMPAVPEAVRAAWRARLKSEGPAMLHGVLGERDPALAARLSPADGQRIVRALEILETTGRSIRHHQERAGRPLVNVQAIERHLVLPDRAVLHRRIAARFAAMVEQGALEEVRRLLSLGLGDSQPVMKAIGVRELGAVLAGRETLEAATAQAVAASRRYAKRQITWFRHQLDDDWRRWPGGGDSATA